MFDWVVTDEWQHQPAHLADSARRVIVHTDAFNVRVVGCSAPAGTCVDLEQVKPQRRSLAERHGAPRYVDSQAEPRPGFGCAQRRRAHVVPGWYLAVVRGMPGT